MTAAAIMSRSSIEEQHAIRSVVASDKHAPSEPAEMSTSIDSSSDEVSSTSVEVVDPKSKEFSGRQRLLFYAAIVLIIVACLGLGLLLFKPFLAFLINMTKHFDTSNVGYMCLFFLLFVLSATPIGDVTFIALTLTAANLYKWWALPLGYTGIVIGASISFRFVRYLVGQGHVSSSTIKAKFGKYAETIECLEGALRDNQFNTVILVQLSVLPFGVSNGLLALTDVEFRPFILATLVSRVKVILYVWIGTNAINLAETIGKIGNMKINWLSKEVLPSIVAISVSIAALLIVFVVCRKRLRATRARALLPSSTSSNDDDSQNCGDV